jgi:hypothetical protein
MNAVLHSFAYALDFLREQVADVPARDMVAQPNGIRNHPAWVIGHLTHTCQLFGGAIGLAEWLPDDWAVRFGNGSMPMPDTAAYESKEEALAILRDAQTRVARVVERFDDVRLNAAFPDRSYLDVFPTVRHALTQVLVGHASYHIGQLTVWRNAIGLLPLRRSFE